MTLLSTVVMLSSAAETANRHSSNAIFSALPAMRPNSFVTWKFSVPPNSRFWFLAIWTTMIACSSGRPPSSWTIRSMATVSSRLMFKSACATRLRMYGSDVPRELRIEIVQFIDDLADGGGLRRALRPLLALLSESENSENRHRSLFNLAARTAYTAHP